MKSDMIYYSIKALHCQGGYNMKEKDMSWCRLSYELMRDTRLTSNDILLYSVLLDQCTESLERVISQDDVTALTGGRISQKTFYRCLEHLERYNYLKHERTGRENSYKLADIIGLKRQKRTITQSRRTEEPEKEAHGTHQHVLLDADQYSRLVSDFGPDKVSEYVQRCDDYCQRTGKSYADYDAVLRKWIAEDKQKASSVRVDEVKQQEFAELDEYLSLVNQFD